MLKAVFFTLLAACSAPVHAFFERASEEDKTVQIVYEAPGLVRDQIASATKLWIAENFRSARNVIDHEDQAEGLLVAKGAIPYPCSGFECVAKGTWSVPFTMRIEMRDQRYRVTFSNIMLSMPELAEIWMKSDYRAIHPKLRELGDSLKTAVTAPKKKEDW